MPIGGARNKGGHAGLVLDLNNPIPWAMTGILVNIASF